MAAVMATTTRNRMGKQMERTCRTKCRFDSCSIYVNFGILLGEYYLRLLNGPLGTVLRVWLGVCHYLGFWGAGLNQTGEIDGSFPICGKTKSVDLLLLFY